MKRLRHSETLGQFLVLSVGCCQQSEAAVKLEVSEEEAFHLQKQKGRLVSSIGSIVMPSGPDNRRTKEILVKDGLVEKERC